MSISFLEQAIIEQNPHWTGAFYDHSIQRIHNAGVLRNLDLDEIQVITGIRRCGKSTLLETIINHLMKQHDPKTQLYINFDDPNYNEVCRDVKQLYRVITAAEKLSGVRVEHLFLDEVQNVEAWEQYVKSMYDSKRFKKIIVTGSNADLLNSEYASLLTGRYIQTQIYPLTFQEIILNNNIKTSLDLINQKPFVLKLLDDFIMYGGFPRVYQVGSAHQRREILKSYYETILLKDCVKTNHIRDAKTLMNLSFYLVSNISACYSYNSLSKVVESNENTVRDFIHAFEGAHFLNELKQFSYSVKQQMRMKKKAYCIDNGFVTAVSFRFSSNFGKLLENLVYTEFKKQNDCEIFFYQGSKECDFILHYPGLTKAFQVCYELDHSSRDREISGLRAAMKTFSISEGIIITYDQEEKIDDDIQVIPFWKYFSQHDEG